jgi:hypothetical protein
MHIPSVGQRLRRMLPRSKKPIIISFALLLTASGGWALQNHSEQRKLAEQTAKATAVRAQQIKDQAEEAKQQQQLPQKTAQQQAQKDAASKTGAAPASDGTTPPTKYSTSSDPRSTAYSTTPPKPNPASFTTKITHAGQVAPGTLISYNASKNEKQYYGGDLLLYPTSITISKSFPQNIPIRITSPDRAVMQFPASPWDEPAWYFAIAGESTADATSFYMHVDPLRPLPLGPHTLHITTTRPGQAADSWRYDAFIPITVVN